MPSRLRFGWLRWAALLVGLALAVVAQGATADCVRSTNCQIPKGISSERRAVLEAAVARLREVRAIPAATAAEAELRRYLPRRCTGYVLDVFTEAGLIPPELLQSSEYHAAPADRYARLRYSKGTAPFTTPNVPVSYFRNAQCTAGTSRLPGTTYRAGCAHPFTRGTRLNRVDPSQLLPGDLWVSPDHVGIVFDPARKIMIHNTNSAGPRFDYWNDAYYGAKRDVIFLRHVELGG